MFVLGAALTGRCLVTESYEFEVVAAGVCALVSGLLMLLYFHQARFDSTRSTVEFRWGLRLSPKSIPRDWSHFSEVVCTEPSGHGDRRSGYSLCLRLVQGEDPELSPAYSTDPTLILLNSYTRKRSMQRDAAALAKLMNLPIVG